MESTKKNARVAGLLYLTLLAAPLRLIYIPAVLFVEGNAKATADNIAAHETLFRLGMLTELFTGAMAIFLTLALYRLFKGVNEGLARLVVILGSLMVTPIYFVNTLNDVAALTLAKGADFLSAFSEPQRDAMAALFLRLHHYGVVVNEVFWGLWLVPFGLLVIRSRFLPRFLGYWLIINCLGYLAIAITALLFPQCEGTVSNVVFPALLGELATMLWLIAGTKELPAE